MTHDLLNNLLQMMGIGVSRIEVCDLKDNTYFALIHFQKGDQEMSIDARPSDAIALSLRVKAPIFVSEEIIDKSKEIDLKPEAEDKTEEGKKWSKILEGLRPEDFGKYKM